MSVLTLFFFASTIYAADRATPLAPGETLDPGALSEPCGPLDQNCFPALLGTYDEGVLLSSNVLNLNFVGDGVTATHNGTTTTITIPREVGLISINGDSSGTQTIVVGTSGSDFNIVTESGVHALNIPDAGSVSRGLVSTSTQTFAGAKTFSDGVTANTLNIGTLDGVLFGTNGSVSAFATSSLGVALSDTSGTLSVSRGGTGATSLTGLLMGNGSSAITAVTGTTGMIPYFSDTNEVSATSSLYIASSGNIGIGTSTPVVSLDVYGDAILSGSERYLNFGTVAGTTGYGIRDNSGTLQFKNNSGSWTTFGTGSSSGNATGTSIVTSVIGPNATNLPQSNTFTSYGGDLIVTVHATFYASTPDSIRGVTVAFDGSSIGELKKYQNFGSNHEAMSNTFVVSGEEAGVHTIALSSFNGAVADDGDFFTVTVQELGTDGIWSTEDENTYLASGNVGIGTTTPGSKLHVLASSVSNKFLDLYAASQGMIVEGSEGRLQFIGRNTGTGGSGLLLTNAPASGNNTHWNINHVGSGIGDGLIFRYSQTTASGQDSYGSGTGTIDALYLSEAGNVGIGTTDPQNSLHVIETGTVNASAGIFGERYGLFAGTGETTSTGYLLKLVAGTSQALSGGTTRFIVKNDGGVGIGTTDPSSSLHVLNSASGVLSRFETTDVNSNAWIGVYNDARSYFVGLRGDTSDNFTIYDNNAGADRFVIDTSGRVGIGTNDPTIDLAIGDTNTGISSGGNGVLEFYENNILAMKIEDGGNVNERYSLYIYESDGSGSCDSANEVLETDSDGRVKCGTEDNSDERIKDIYGDNEEYGLANVLQANTIRYNFKKDWGEFAGYEVADDYSIKHVGFSAQQLQSIMPDLVYNNDEDGPGIKSLDHLGLTAVSFKAIQDISSLTFGTSDDALALTADILPEGLSPALISLASTTATITVTGEDGKTQDTFLGMVFKNFTKWFANTKNGIGKFFADEIYTDKICVATSDGEYECFTGDELRDMTQDSHSSQARQQIVDNSEDENLPDDTEEEDSIEESDEDEVIESESTPEELEETGTEPETETETETETEIETEVEPEIVTETEEVSEPEPEEEPLEIVDNIE